MFVITLQHQKMEHIYLQHVNLMEESLFMLLNVQLQAHWNAINLVQYNKLMEMLMLHKLKSMVTISLC